MVESNPTPYPYTHPIRNLYGTRRKMAKLEVGESMEEQEIEICPYCEMEIIYNGPEDFDPVSVDEADNYYHDDCFFDKFGYACGEEGDEE